jgi:2,3-dihydroxy-p-cumate/2,3-dihydroxybenzoate 3,4-dioxygenase
LQHRYSRLGYVALNVSNVERSAQFYEKLWGLQANGQDAAGNRFFRCGNDHHNIVLYQGNPGLKRLGWQLESDEDLQRLSDTLHQKGLRVREVDAAECTVLHQGPTLRFTEPFTGATHEFFTRMDGESEEWTPSVAKIQRVGHVVLKATDYKNAVRFYEEVMNFRISDAIGDRVSFMRCFPSPFHHSVGLSNSPKRGLHHVNFMVSDIDDIGKALWRFRKNEVPIVRGPGRHPPSGSIFLYVLDPDGLTVEYSFGMEEFPEVDFREHRVLAPVPESIDLWGAPTDSRLGAVGHIEDPSFAEAGFER